MTESGLILAADSTCIPPSKFRQVIVQIEENRRAGAICGIDSAPKRFHVWRARGKQSSFRLGLDLLVRLAHNLLGRRDRPPQRRSRPASQPPNLLSFGRYPIRRRRTAWCWERDQPGCQAWAHLGPARARLKGLSNTKGLPSDGELRSRTINRHLYSFGDESWRRLLGLG